MTGTENKAKLEQYRESSDYIAAKLPFDKADFAIVLGSGLGGLADELEDTVKIPYKDIPNFPVSTVSYQKGELVAGKLRGKNVIAMNGRFHYYEGWEMWQCAYHIFVFALLGVKRAIITNAAGAINESFRPGDLVRVTDTIKLTADSPLRGRNIPEFGERFFDMQTVHDKTLARLADEAAMRLGFELKTGVYAYMGGPQYETPAEIRMLRILGADLVGMSTVPEIIAAAQVKMGVLCLSCASNMAAGITGAAITESEVLEAGARSSGNLRAVVSDVVERAPSI